MLKNQAVPGSAPTQKMADVPCEPLRDKLRELSAVMSDINNCVRATRSSLFGGWPEPDDETKCGSDDLDTLLTNAINFAREIRQHAGFVADRI